MSLALVFEAVANATTTAIASAPANLASSSPAFANSTSLQGIVPAIQNFATAFAANMGVVTLTLDNAAVDIGKAAVIFLIIAGVILWMSSVARRLGKELVKGGIAIAFFIEFVVPFLMSIHF